MAKPKIGITVGDINGIGLEVILKTLNDERLLNICTPIIYGSSKVVSYHKNIVNIEFQFYSTHRIDAIQHGKINVINVWQEGVNITLGKLNEIGGKYAFASLEAAVADWKAGQLDALVTAPINKKAMEMAGFQFPGHTEYLTEKAGAADSLMLMVNDGLRVGLISGHVPLRAVGKNISKEKIIQKIQMLDKSLRVDFGLERPAIAVLGLNPHAGDGGLLGREEEDLIRPAIVEAKKGGVLVQGPFPADGFFGSGQYKKYDGILAMYHDQGLVPFKALSFSEGVNYTAGLPFVRTSPDHGTAFDIAGQNVADPTSFRQAIFLAIDVARSRKDHTEMHANALVRTEKGFNEEEDEVITEE